MRVFALVLITAGVASAEPGSVDFGRDVLPVLAENCFACHGPDEGQRKAELRLDVEDAAKAKVIVAGDPDASELLARITSADADKRMPPPDSNKNALTAAQIELLRSWIASGAGWSEHWSFVPPERPELPQVANTSWARNGIDHFVLARLEAEGLQPSVEANRETLIRRLSLDLTGLPPALEAIDAFVMDNSPDAYEQLVDRLLASPRYGENLARDWLDGARYADTNGYQNDFQRSMYLWRDWVIDAFNANLPFDQFTVEQIAGDLLPDATDEQRIATGFNRNNRSNTEGGAIEDEWRIENIVDRVETTGAVFLGLSIGCARCHDHKYEPISQKEFYEFFAFFNSTEDKGFYEETRGNTGPIVSRPSFENQRKIAEFDRRIGEAQRDLDAAVARQASEHLGWLAWLGQLEPAADLPAAYTADLSGAAMMVDGLIGPAVGLLGTPESHVDLGQAVAFDAGKPFSVSMWVRPDKPGALFSKMDDANKNRGVDTLVTAEGELVVHVISEWDTNALRVISDRRLRMGTWAHVSVTYDGSSKAGGVQVYVNGEPAVLKLDKDALTGPIDTAEPLRLGRRSSGEHLTGAISDFRYYDRVLAAAEIAPLIDGAIAATFKDGATAERRALLSAFFDLRYANALIDDRANVDGLNKERADYVSGSVPTVMVMRELEEPRPTYRLIRGAYHTPDQSEDLKPKIPAFLGSIPEHAPNNRLGLAMWLVDPSNPLTARVTVNRYWQSIFGQGLVKTTEDFGVQGSPPSHPELLDWLAAEFVASGWDLKALMKLMVTSAAYRQSSAASPDLQTRDPENVLLARAPRYRLPAEVLRDNALAVSGLLTDKIGGPSVRPYQPEGLWAELAGGAGEGPYVQSTGEDLYRRSLYIYRKRTVPPPSLTTFDSPGWDICLVRRGRTNTPLQSLALLNDVTYVEAARNLAQRMLAEAGPDARDKIAFGFRAATGRRPDARELEVLSRGLEGYVATFNGDAEAAAALIAHGESPVDANAAPAELAAYMTVASVILNLDESLTRE